MHTRNDHTRWRQKLRHAAGTAGLVLLAIMTVAAVHEEGVLKLVTRTLVAGDSVSVQGERFARNSSMTLALLGVTGQLNLGTVRSDSTGKFALPLLVPANAAAGSYRLVAIADDGDEVASVDVTVSPAAAAADHAAMGHEEMADDPSDAPLALDRAESPLLTWTVVAGIVAALASGVALLRRRAADRQ
ncbi:MAG TPA: hypothetical protein VNL18_04525 [Gemmatimonadales bacterium]|nr:hypothetical protein [Gemmatimonadales bacterium]